MTYDATKTGLNQAIPMPGYAPIPKTTYGQAYESPADACKRIVAIEKRLADIEARMPVVCPGEDARECGKPDPPKQMTFMQAFDAMKEGERVRRRIQADVVSGYIVRDNQIVHSRHNFAVYFAVSDIEATDWEIVE